MQLVRGPSLAQLRETRELDPARALELLADVGSALDAAHRAGIAHGAVAARNVLVDRQRPCAALGLRPLGRRAHRGGGQSRLCGPRAGLPRRPPAAAPRSALARGGRRRPARASGAAATPSAPTSRRRSRRRLRRRGRRRARDRPARWLGRGTRPGPAARERSKGARQRAGVRRHQLRRLQRTASERSIPGLHGRPGSPARPPRWFRPLRGVIRRWVVRGASGELALQVVRRRGGGYVSVARSRSASVPDDGVHVLPANLAVRAGDLIGVQLAPGAAIGVRRGVPGATTARWLGQLFVEPRSIELGAGSGFDHEILLRAEYTRGREADVGRPAQWALSPGARPPDASSRRARSRFKAASGAWPW